TVKTLSPDDIYPHLPQFTARLIAFTTRHNIKYDVIYSNYWLSGWVGQKLKESWGTPFVQMFHTLGQMKQRILTHESIMPNQRICTETEIVEWADRIIAATPAEHSQLMWLYRANRRKIGIVPPGVNTERFYPRSEARAKAELGIDDSKKMLLFVGRIEPLKAIDSIIHALNVIRANAPDILEQICFTVVGGDPHDSTDGEMQRLQSLTREYGLSDVVDFVGAKDQNLLPAYYAAATAVIMPSDYESFGMVSLEAMATGTPVIASNVGGLSYLVKDEQTGYLVPVRQADVIAERITRLVTDDTLARSMGDNAAELAKQYAWSNIADRLCAVFDDILGQKSARAV
ncbi:MAG: glycosyltransferase, partial [Chloroflexota bacterium]